jgi:hypothetical protein
METSLGIQGRSHYIQLVIEGWNGSYGQLDYRRQVILISFMFYFFLQQTRYAKYFDSFSVNRFTDLSESRKSSSASFTSLALLLRFPKDTNHRKDIV